MQAKDPDTETVDLGKTLVKTFPPALDANPIWSGQVMIKHPNSNGMQLNINTAEFIPARFVKDVVVKRDGELVFQMEGTFSISTNPNFRFTFAKGPANTLDVAITDTDLTFERKIEQIEAEALLDGIYVLRTNLEPEALDATSTVSAYKGLATVERAFRSLKTVDLEVRPIHHRRAQRVRAHVLLCMLAYYLEWHMRQALKPILFDDHDKAAADAARASIVAKAERSKAADRKAATKRTPDGLPVHSFRSLLADLATVTRNTMAMTQSPEATFVLYPTLTPVQDRVFQLLGVPVKL